MSHQVTSHLKPPTSKLSSPMAQWPYMSGSPWRSTSDRWTPASRASCLARDFEENHKRFDQSKLEDISEISEYVIINISFAYLFIYLILSYIILSYLIYLSILSYFILSFNIYLSIYLILPYLTLSYLILSYLSIYISIYLILSYLI